MIYIEVEEVCSNLVGYKHTLTSSLVFTSLSDVCLIDVPKPNAYNRTRNVIIVENLLFLLDSTLVPLVSVMRHRR